MNPKLCQRVGGVGRGGWWDRMAQAKGSVICGVVPPVRKEPEERAWAVRDRRRGGWWRVAGSRRGGRGSPRERWTIRSSSISSLNDSKDKGGFAVTEAAGAATGAASCLRAPCQMWVYVVVLLHPWCVSSLHLRNRCNQSALPVKNYAFHCLSPPGLGVLGTNCSCNPYYLRPLHNCLKLFLPLLPCPIQ